MALKDKNGELETVHHIRYLIFKKNKAKYKQLYSEALKNRNVNELISKNKKKLENAGVLIDTNGDMYIKAKSKMTRYAGQEPIDNKRKYVSLLKDDAEEYKKEIDNIGITPGSKAYRYTYINDFDMSVADAKTVMDYIANEYGSHRFKNFNQFLWDVSNGDMESLYPIDGYVFDKLDTNTKEENALNEEWNYIGKKLTHILYYDHNSDITEYFHKNGYDAIIDVNDYIQGFTDFPLILIDPAETINTKDVKKKYIKTTNP